MGDIIKTEAVNSLAHSGFAGTYTTLVTSIPSDVVAIDVMSTLDAAVMLSLDGGTTDHVPIPAGIDPTAGIVGSGLIPIYRALGHGDVCFHAGSAIKVKDIGTPAAGSIYVIMRTRV